MLPRQGSLMTLEPRGVRIVGMAQDPKTGDVVLRIQAENDSETVLTWQGQRMELGFMPAGKILSWILSRKGTSWDIRP
jgi:hypothetical protein